MMRLAVLREGFDRRFPDARGAACEDEDGAGRDGLVGFDSLLDCGEFHHDFVLGESSKEFEG